MQPPPVLQPQQPPSTPVRAAVHPVEDVETAIKTYEKVLKSAVADSPKKKSPSKCSPSKKPCFLRKESTLTDFTAWDVDDRLHEVEAQFRALKDVMNSSLTDRKSQDEALELAKTRSKFCTPPRKNRERRVNGALTVKPP